MKQFSCGDVVSGCTKVFTARDDTQILTQVGEHARADHGLVAIPDELVAQVRSKIFAVA